MPASASPSSVADRHWYADQRRTSGRATASISSAATTSRRAVVPAAPIRGNSVDDSAAPTWSEVTEPSTRAAPAVLSLRTGAGTRAGTGPDTGPGRAGSATGRAAVFMRPILTAGDHPGPAHNHEGYSSEKLTIPRGGHARPAPPAPAARTAPPRHAGGRRPGPLLQPLGHLPAARATGGRGRGDAAGAGRPRGAAHPAGGDPGAPHGGAAGASGAGRGGSRRVPHRDLGHAAP